MTSPDEGSRRRERWPHLRRLMLSIGFLAIAIGLLFAWNAPADGYEVSIYAATPTIFWIAAIIGLGTSLLSCGINPHDRVAIYSVGLGATVILSIAALPLVRSYRYLGASDALTHLGYAEDIRAGLMSPTELLYPGGHTAAIIVGETLRMPTGRAFLLWIFILLGIYLLFVPMLARAIVDHPLVTVVAAYSAFLLLPINNVSTVYQFHSYSLGVMLLPIFGYALVRYLQSGSVLRFDRAWNVLLVLTGAGMLFIHPQVHLNLIILLGTFAAVHFLARRRFTDHPLTHLRPTYGAFLILAALWLVWSFQHWQAMAAIENLAGGLYYTIIGDQAAGEATANVGISAEQIGGSLTELFLKIFLVSLAYSIVATAVVLTAFLATVRRSYRRDYSVISYVGFGGLALGPFFTLYFLGDIATYFFRHLGFAMVFVTVLGAIGIYYLGDRLSGRGGSPSLRTVGIMCLAAALILSVPVLYSSPYLYLPSSHVSDGEMDGYAKSFEITDDTLLWSGIRTGPGRFFDGLTPGDRPTEATGHSVSEGDELVELVEGGGGSDMYLPISERDYTREVYAYRELRISDEDFQAVEDSPRVNRVHTNDEYNLYYVRGD